MDELNTNADILDSLAEEVEQESRDVLEPTPVPKAMQSAVAHFDQSVSKRTKADGTLLAFDKSFAYEVALQYEPLKDVMARYDVPLETMRMLARHEPFVQQVRLYRAELKRDGVTFKTKAAVLAEELLKTAFSMANDPDIPAQVRATNIANIVRWGHLEPPKVTDTSGGEKNSFSIQINLGDSDRPARAVTIDAD